MRTSCGPSGPGGVWISALVGESTCTGARPSAMNTFMPLAKPAPVSVIHLPPFKNPSGGDTPVTANEQSAVSTRASSITTARTRSAAAIAIRVGRLVMATARGERDHEQCARHAATIHPRRGARDYFFARAFGLVFTGLFTGFL